MVFARVSLGSNKQDSGLREVDQDLVEAADQEELLRAPATLPTEYILALDSTSKSTQRTVTFREVFGFTGIHIASNTSSLFHSQ